MNRCMTDECMTTVSRNNNLLWFKYPAEEIFWFSMQPKPLEEVLSVRSCPKC